MVRSGDRLDTVGSFRSSHPPSPVHIVDSKVEGLCLALQLVAYIRQPAEKDHPHLGGKVRLQVPGGLAGMEEDLQRDAVVGAPLAHGL